MSFDLIVSSSHYIVKLWIWQTGSYISTLPLIRTLYCWVLSKEVSSTIFKVFGMTWPGFEPRSPGPLVNSQPTWPKEHNRCFLTYKWRNKRVHTIPNGIRPKVNFCMGGTRSNALTTMLQSNTLAIMLKGLPVPMDETLGKRSFLKNIFYQKTKKKQKKNMVLKNPLSFYLAWLFSLRINRWNCFLSRQKKELFFLYKSQGGVLVV